MHVCSIPPWACFCDHTHLLFQDRISENRSHNISVTLLFILLKLNILLNVCSNFNIIICKIVCKIWCNLRLLQCNKHYLCEAHNFQYHRAESTLVTSITSKRQSYNLHRGSIYCFTIASDCITFYWCSCCCSFPFYYTDGLYLATCSLLKNPYLMAKTWKTFFYTCHILHMISHNPGPALAHL